jgi:hypothetical protein
MLARIKRWISQGQLPYVPTYDDFNAAMRTAELEALTIQEAILLLSLDHCRNYVICVSEHEPSARVRNRFRSARKRLLHVSLRRFTPEDIDRLRTPTYDSLH